MTSRFRLTLAVALSLSGAYFLYAFGTGIVLRVGASGSGTSSGPPARQSSADGPSGVVIHSDSAEGMAERHLKDTDWAKHAKIQLKNKEELFYYSQSWEQTDDRSSFRFEPFALIWFTKPDQEPMVITADSALITFERPIEPSNPDPGRIMGGQLNGQVRVRGADNLDVTGLDFVFSESDARFWSDNPVTFAWLEHRGRSQRGIQIDLDIDPDSADASQMAVKGVKQVHLFREVEMNFVFEQKGQPLPIDVSARGSFHLQLQNGSEQKIEEAIATFDDQVVVRRWTSKTEADVMMCDRLSMYLDEPNDVGLKKAMAVHRARSSSNQIATVSAEKEVVSEKDVPGLLKAPGNSNLRFRRMRATGEVVRLLSDVNQIEATMETLEYDVDTNRVLLNDLNPNEVRPETRRQLPWVVIRQKDGQIRCRQIELTHEEDGRLREVFCRGQGDLKLFARDKDQKVDSRKSGSAFGAASRPTNSVVGPAKNVLEAQWTRQLRQYRDERANQDVIDLTGDAVVRMPGNSAIVAADYIKVWADPLQNDSSNEDEPEPGTPRLLDDTTAQVGKPRKEPVPRKILAQGHVTLVSPEMQGQMDELQAWIEDAPSGTVPASVPRRLEPVSMRVDDQNILQTGMTQTKKKPVFVSSKLTRVLIRRFGEEFDPHVEEVWSEGSVEITHHREDSTEPMVLLADRLHVQNRAENDQVLHLFGRPARIADPQMNLVGEEIFFDRHRNLVWVDGGGTLKLPVTRDFDGNELKDPTELSVSWIDQMVFDGLEARFTGRVHATTLDSVMRCQKMIVTMSERVSFQEQSKSKKRPDVATVLCQYNVEFSSHRMEEASLEEVRRARFAAFSFDNRSGRVEAQGPGYLAVWRRGQGKRASLGPLGAAGANRGMQTQKTGWEYIRIDFARDMIGNVKKKSTVARGEVQVIYSPVDEPLAMVNLDRLSKDGGAISCDSLELIQRTSVKNGNYIELLASGNASLEGKTFYGLADEVSYDESKGLYMLKSYGENESTLWREKQRGAERTVVGARTFRYTPSTNSIMFDDASHVQGVQ